ncbi:MAG: hypothetical protein JW740_00070 [Candidatus Zambryskibacteria bacterium]|nr:hypothetical protein [Candidatus Zambryskibacteria bacterium]
MFEGVPNLNNLEKNKLLNHQEKMSQFESSVAEKFNTKITEENVLAKIAERGNSIESISERF